MPKKILTLTFIFIVGLIFSGPFSLAQTNVSPNPTDTSVKNPEPAKPAIEEDHDTKNLNKLLQDYNKDSEKVIKDAATIKDMEATGEVSDKDLGNGAVINPDNENALDEAHKVVFEKANFKKRLEVPKANGKYSDQVRIALTALQSLPEAELLEKLKETIKGTSTEVYFTRNPKFTVFMVRLIKSPDAIPKIVSIADDQDKLIRFIGIMVSTILVGFFLKRFFKKEGRSVLAALGFWFLRFLILSALRFAIILYFYGAEITPTLNIAAKTFF